MEKSIIKERRAFYAKCLAAEGVDLSKDWFSLPHLQRDTCARVARFVRYTTKNPCLLREQAFFYAAKAGLA